MPNKTFNNLSKEKQETLIEISLKEFIEHDYDSASLNQIINELGIAKGSFYRYFDSKKDLYLYLIDYCINKKIEYIHEFTDASTDDFFVKFKNIMYHYVKFNMNDSLYAIFLLKAYRNNDIGIDDFLFLRNGKHELIQAMIKLQKDGRLSDEYDIEFIFYCMTQILSGMGPYIKEKQGIINDKLLAEEKIDDYQINLVFGQVVNFFKNGFGAK